MTRVVVVEDHTLVRQSLVKMVSAEPGFEVVGESGRGDEAVELIARVKPDLALLDIAMPGGDGLDVAEQAKAKTPDTRMLFLTMHEDDASIVRAVGLGADGYVLKTASTEELMQALRTVASGSSYLSPRIAKRIMNLAGSRNSATHTRLTERELEILRLLSSGVRPAELAKRLFVSVKTIKNHLTNIYAKLGVQTGTQAVAEAFRRGLVSTPLRD
jgi:two-component system, NarL family, response regulator NreC